MKGFPPLFAANAENATAPATRKMSQKAAGTCTNQTEARNERVYGDREREKKRPEV